jgi:hypothetical protein
MDNRTAQMSQAVDSQCHAIRKGWDTETATARRIMARIRQNQLAQQLGLALDQLVTLAEDSGRCSASSAA